MTTTVRSVRVELEMGITSYVANATTAGRVTENMADRMQRGVVKANASINSLDKSTGNLVKTSAQARVSQTGLSDSIDKTGRSASRSEASIDKYSGRLKTILGLVQVLGPAALRLGAGALPVLSAGFAGLGAAGGGIGVTVLALHGVSDGLKALNDYELERTPENLAKVQQAFAELGPEGAHFVQTLRDLGPEIDHIQQLARAGVLPGFEDSLQSLQTRVPIVSQIVNRLSQEVGRLSADAGDALAGDEWTPFFNYVRGQAAPILDDFARSAGNVALGLANILVAFDPLTRKFTGGLEDMTQRFADWSQGLEDDQGFQDFLDTVEQAGPELLDFAGSIVQLFTGIVRASAPLAQTTLPILTGIVKTFAAIADSPVGPVIYTAATAWTIYSRAALLADKATTRIQTSWAGMSKGGAAGRGAAGIGLIATALTDYDDKAGLANTTTLGLTAALAGGGPLGIGLAATAGLLIDITKANDDLAESTTRANTALRSGDTSQMRDQLQQLQDEIQETDEAANLALGGVSDIGGVSGAIDKLGSLWSKYSGEEDDAKQAAAELDSALHSNRSTLDVLKPVLGSAADGLIDAARAAQRLSSALAILNGWFDKRDAVRGYKDAIKELAQGLKDGFNRDDVGNIDAVGRSILQVANLIQNPARRADFLADARAQLTDLADRSGPRAAAAVQKVIDKFDSTGLTNPPPIKLTVDQKNAEAAFARTRRSMSALDRTTATPTVQVDPGNTFSLLGGVRSQLAALVAHTWTVTVNTVTNAIPHFATGGYTGDGGKHDVAGVVHKGEYVVDAEHTRRDRGMLESRYGSLPGYAKGGLVADTYTSRRGATVDGTPGYQPFHLVNEPLHEAATAADRVAASLKKLQDRVDKVQKSYEKEKSKLDDLISQRDSAASSIASSALHDPFGNGLAGLDAQVEADTGDIESMTAALATLVRNGLDPKSALYQQLAASMDVNTAQQLAQLSAADLQSRAQRFQNRSDEAGGLGLMVANQSGLQAAIEKSSRVTDRLDHRLEQLADAIHDLKDTPKKMHDAVYTAAKQGTSEGAEEGTRNGNDEKRRRVRAAVRTGSN